MRLKPGGLQPPAVNVQDFCALPHCCARWRLPKFCSCNTLPVRKAPICWLRPRAFISWSDSNPPSRPDLPRLTVKTSADGLKPTPCVASSYHRTLARHPPNTCLAKRGRAGPSRQLRPAPALAPLSRGQAFVGMTSARGNATVYRRMFRLTTLQRRLRSKDHRRLRRQYATVAMHQCGFRARHLARAAFAAQLTYCLDQQEQAVHAGMAV